MAEKFKIDLNSGWLIILLGIGGTSVIVALGFFYFSQQISELKQTKDIEFSTITKMKINQIVQWRKERNGDALVISHSLFFTSALERLLVNKTNDRLKEDLANRLLIPQKEYGYNTIFLATIKGEILLSVGAKTDHLDIITLKKIAEAVASQKITWTDIYYCKESDKINYDIIAPMVNAKDQTTAVIVLRVDPNEFLYPLVQFCPTTSKTLESLLVRKDDDSVVFLNELKLQKHTALRLKIPLTSREVPAVQAALGYQGLWEGKDYRGVDVMSNIRKVPDTDWFMVTKMDKSEMYIDVYRELKFLIIGVMLIFILLVLGLSFLYSLRQRNIYRKLFDAQKKMNAAESGYRRLFEAAQDGILILDAESGMIKDVNPFLIEMLGYSKEQFLDKAIWEIGFFQHITANKDKFLELQQKQYVRYENLPLESADGHQKSVEFVSNIYLVNSHKVIQCNIRDITDRVQAEEFLKLEEVRLQTQLELHKMMDATQDQLFDFMLGAIQKSIQSPFAYIGTLDEAEAVETIHRWSENVMEQCAVHNKQMEFQISESGLWGECVRQRKPVIVNSYADATDKKGTPVGHVPIRRFMAVPVFDGRKIVAVAAVANKVFEYDETDVATLETLTNRLWGIIKRKRVEEELRTTRDYLDNLVNYANAPIIVWNPGFIITRFNSAFEHLSGYQADEAIGRKLDFLFPESSAKASLTKIAITSTGEHWESVEIPILRKDGQVCIALWNSASLYEQGSKTVIATIAQGQDITQRKQAQDMLELKNEQLNQANAEKDKFFSIVAHDLRSPFNSLLGFTEIMEKELPTMTRDQIQQIAVTMRKSATNLYRLLENLLEWSRLQRGLITFNPEPMLLMPRVLDETVLLIESANKKEITLNFNIPEDLTVYADENMLGGILRNLTSNAVKFTPKGGKVIIAAKSLNNTVECSVCDTGIGMNHEIKKNLFNIDVNTSRKGTEKEPSTGLGLILCKEFVEKHGGRLWVESEEAKGSTFYFTLPGKEL